MGELDWLVPVIGLLISLYFIAKGAKKDYLEIEEWSKEYESIISSARNRKSDCTPKEKEDKPMVSINDNQQGVRPAGISSNKNLVEIDFTIERNLSEAILYLPNSKRATLTSYGLDILKRGTDEAKSHVLKQFFADDKILFDCFRYNPDYFFYYAEANEFYYTTNILRRLYSVSCGAGWHSASISLDRKEFMQKFNGIYQNIDWHRVVYDKYSHIYYLYKTEEKKKEPMVKDLIMFSVRELERFPLSDSDKSGIETHLNLSRITGDYKECYSYLEYLKKKYSKASPADHSLLRIQEEVSAEVDKTFQPLMSKLYSLAGLPEDYSVSTSNLNANSITASTLNASSFNPEDSYLRYLQKSPYRSFSLDDNSIHKPAHTIKKKVVAREWFIGIKETEEEQKLRYLIQEEKILGWDYF